MMKLVNILSDRLKFVRSGKSLFGQVNFQTLSDRLSCKVSQTFVKTEVLIRITTHVCFYGEACRIIPKLGQRKTICVVSVTFQKHLE